MSDSAFPMSSFNPTRLDLARKRRGITKMALADSAGISSRSLTAYERGEKIPSPATLAKIAATLRFPITFFSGPDLDEPPLDGSSFRAFSSRTARQRDRALGSAALALALSDWIAARFTLPESDVLRLRAADPETAAEAIRSAWRLGERSIRNMVHLLEAHGVRVFSLSEDCTEIDAFSFWREGVPYVFLNTMKSAERSRMDAAHELGHLALHWRGGPRGRDAEKEADLFGSAFLMPRGSVLAEAPRGGRLDDLVQAKSRWNVSVTNLTYRMRNLGLLTEWQYRSLFVEIGEKGYRKNEPKGLPRETSQVLAKVFKTLRDEGVSRTAVARKLNIHLEELNKIIFGLVLMPLDGEAEPGQDESVKRPTLHVV